MMLQSGNKENNAAIQFLGNAGKILSESLDYETILKSTAVLVLDFLADLCFIDLLEDVDGKDKVFHRIVSMTKDVSKDAIANELMNFSSQDVRASLKGRVIDDFCSEVRASHASEQYVNLLEQLNCGSAVIMPLESHDKIFGVLALVRERERPKYSQNEIELIAEFARRAAMAIENARLYRQAQQAVEAKTQFLANMSHEIRTPLGVMLGFVELLQEQDMPFEQRKHYLNIIARNGQQLLELVGDLLDLTRIDLGKIEINPLEVSLVDILTETVDGFSIKASEKKLKIVADIDPLVPKKIMIDPLRVRQIVINLLSNAIKFSSDGIIYIKIKSTALDHHYRIVMEVRDRGIGIASDKQSKLFQPFTQADFTMTRKFGGAGLGLYLSRKIAKVMGGDVELVTSAPGKGSVFRFSFVANSAATSTQHYQTEKVHQVEDRRTSLTTKKVLLVEDSIDNQLLIAKILENENLEIDTAENGQQALQKTGEKKYDLILMDIQMPLIDGYTTTLRLREKGILTPIVAITAHALPSDRQHCREVGCNGYITKPIDKVSFRNTVRSYL